MSLTFLSAGAFAAGLVVLAGLLFALQRLRVRHRDVPVVTTMFWREAVEEARARELVRRFRHPWAYLLVLALAALLWTVVAGPRQDDRTGRRLVLLLDASAPMRVEGRFGRAAEALVEAAAAFPEGRTTVLACGAGETTLLRHGESAALLARRLEGLRPEASPPSVEQTLLEIARSEGAPSTSVVVFGDAPVRAEALAFLPEGMEVSRGGPAGGGTPPPRPRVVALGASEAASGDWTAVDLLVSVEGGAAALDALRLDGAPAEPTATPRESGDGRGTLVVRDVPARGGVVRASIEGVPASAREIALPDRTPVRVSLDPSLEAVLGPWLAADLAVERVAPDGAPEVVIERAVSAPLADGAGPARLTFVPDDATVGTFVARDRVAAGAGTDADLRRRVDDLGLAELDADALAAASGRPIVLVVEPGAVRGVVAGESLLSPERGLLGSRSLPVFVSRTVRWLADRPPLRAEVVAGAPLDGVTRLVDAAGRTLDAGGLDVVPRRAGRYADERGAPVAAVLPAAGARLAGADDPLRSNAAEERPSRGVDLATWLLLVAALGLALEWWLHRTGRMP
ncbi:MAG: hypothetical protein ACF8XB_21620 [Planctomycetota bacterium JB042]